MTQEQERIKGIVALKQRLEKRLAKMDVEVKELQATLDTVNAILLEKGFKRGSIKEAEEHAAQATKQIDQEMQSKGEAASPKESKAISYHGGEPDNVIPLKTLNEESLAIIYIEKDNSIHVLPDESKHFSVNTPPFGNFLIERVLAKMQDKDQELVRLEQMTPDKMFSYSVVREGEFIREIIIRNVNEERFKELKSSIRWTFDKMYEKMRQPT
jgi:hypothetical protein